MEVALGKKNDDYRQSKHEEGSDETLKEEVLIPKAPLTPPPTYEEVATAKL